eukprot:Nk52_evm125s151 gene=Nk52_evmTU125s151
MSSFAGGVIKTVSRYIGMAVLLGFTLLFSPILIPLAVLVLGAMYGLVFYLYIKYAQRDFMVDEDFPPTGAHGANGSLPLILPLGLTRVVKLTIAFIGHISVDFQFAPTVLPGLWQYYSSDSAGFLFRDVSFNSSFPSCKLDVYSSVLPRNAGVSIDPSDGTSPVIIFIYGGAWSSGDKKLYFMMAKKMMDLGFVVVIPNYPLYPDTKIDAQLDCVRQCCIWTFDNICKYGGNGRKCYLVGHSAGAHIASTLLVYNALAQIYGDKERFFNRKTSSQSSNVLSGDGHVDMTVDNFLQQLCRKHLKRPTLDCAKIKGFIGIGGVYDIPGHFEYEAFRGVEEVSAMVRNMGGLRKSFLRSPALLLKDTFISSLNIPMKIGMKMRTYFPKMTLLHGETDTTTPPKTSKEFHRVLCQHGIDVSLDIVPSCKHSDLILALMKETKHTAFIEDILLGLNK